MFAFYAAATGLVLAGTFVWVCVRHRDPFHPGVFLTPMCGYLFAFIPWIYHRRGLLADYPPSPDKESFAQLVIFLSVTALCGGLVSVSPDRRWNRATLHLPVLTPGAASKLKTAALVLASLSIFIYWLQLSRAGGFVRAFSRGKGGGASLGSGYLNEVVLLCLPAVMMYLFAKAREKVRIETFVVSLLILSPLLLQGLLGGRRGPTFLAFAALGAGWYLSRGRRPPLLLAVGGISLAGLLMLFLVSERRELYIGSDYQFDAESYGSTIVPAAYDPGDTTVSAWTNIIAAKHFDRHFDGRRYFAQVFVRPIPRQIWPTKYEDMGVGWMVDNPGYGAFSEEEWIAATGMVPVAGSAVGFAADSFLEFGWGCLVVSWLAGMLYAILWKRCVTRGGIWILLYLEAGAVSVYLASQGLMSAWMYRLLYLGLPTVLVWRFLAPRLLKASRRWRLVALPEGAAPPPGAVRVSVPAPKEDAAG